MHSLVRALMLMHTRLDYCNGILANAPQSLVNSLRSVLRAARVVLRMPFPVECDTACVIGCTDCHFLSG